jgi:hypothetical protein
MTSMYTTGEPWQPGSSTCCCCCQCGNQRDLLLQPDSNGVVQAYCCTALPAFIRQVINCISDRLRLAAATMHAAQTATACSFNHASAAQC